MAFKVFLLALCLGLASCENKKTPASREVYRDSLVVPQTSVETPEWLVDWGKIHDCLARGDQACACQLAQKWVDSLVDQRSLWALHGRCLLEQEGRGAEALEWLNQAYSQDSSDSVIGFWRARAQQLAIEETQLGLIRSVHFDLQVEDQAFTQGPRLLEALEEAYDSLCLLWQFYPSRRLGAVLYAHPLYNGGYHLPDWTGALFDGKVRIPANVLENWPSHQRVVAHEVAHAFHRELAGGRLLPLWLEEGLAQAFDGTVLDTPWLRAHPLEDSLELEIDFIKTQEAEKAYTLYQHSLQRTLLWLNRVGRDSLKTLMREPWGEQ